MPRYQSEEPKRLEIVIAEAEMASFDMASQLLSIDQVVTDLKKNGPERRRAGYWRQQEARIVLIRQPNISLLDTVFLVSQIL